MVVHHVGLQVSVEGEHHEKAVELLKAAPASVKLVVRYTPKVKRIEFIWNIVTFVSRYWRRWR